MADLYGTGKQIYQAGGQAVQQAGQKATNRASEMFGWSSQAKGVAARQGANVADLLKYGMQDLGNDVMRKQSGELDQIIGKLDTDMNDLRTKAIESRKQMKLEEYQHYTQLRAARAEQKAKIKATKTQRIGEIVTGIGEAVALVLGTKLGEWSASGRAATRAGSMDKAGSTSGYMDIPRR